MGNPSNLRGVSFIMAALDEEQYLRTAVESVISAYPRDYSELVLVLGPSKDKTSLIAEQLVRETSSEWLRLVPVEFKSTPLALNLAIQRSVYDTIIRVDAHCALNKDYARIAVELLDSKGVAVVGGRMVARGTSAFQDAVAHAYNNRIGLGGGGFHVGGKSGAADTVYLGVFARTWLERVGGYDPTWLRAQDWELNLRIREAGGIVWFDPRIQADYFPRRSLGPLVRQFFQTGVWRGKLTRKAPRQSSFRYLAPPLLLVSSLFILPLLTYLFVIAGYCLVARNLSAGARLRLAFILPVMHFSWGTGFVLGFLRRQAAEQARPFDWV